MAWRLLLALVASASLSGPTLALGEDVEEIDACMRKNFPERTSKQTVDLVSTDRTGTSRTLKAEIHWRQSEENLARTLIEVEAPPTDRGSRYLWREEKEHDNTWVCLPELGRVRRIHPSSGDGALFGSDLSYEDVQHLQRISKETTSKRLPDTTIGERTAYVVRADMVVTEESAYHHIVYSIDKESCLPLQIEFFDEPENRRKLLKSDPASFSRQGEGWVARSLTIEDLADGTVSTLEVEEIDVDAEVPDRLFTLAHLERRCR
jgi:outer membrane lipoprotein-sorting protein